MTGIATRVRRFLGLETEEVAQPPEPDIEEEPEPEPERPVLDVETPAWDWTGGEETPGDFRSRYKANGCDPITSAQLEVLIACDRLFGEDWFTIHDLSSRMINRDEYTSRNGPWSASLHTATKAGFFERRDGQQPYEYRVLVEPREARQLPKP